MYVNLSYDFVMETCAFQPRILFNNIIITFFNLKFSSLILAPGLPGATISGWFIAQ